MPNLLNNLNAVNAIEDDNEFLVAAKPLIVHDFLGTDESDVENMMTMALLKSENDDNVDAINDFSTRLMSLMNDMDYNDTEHMAESNSRVYKGWLAADKTLPKLSDYVLSVKNYLNEIKK